MDLSKLSTEDLQSLSAGDLGKVSNEGLMMLRAQQPAEHEQPQGNGMPYGTVAEMSGPERFRAGLGKSAVDLVRGLGNIAHIVPDSDIKEAEARDKPLMDTPGGAGGHLTGEIVNTLPLTMGATSALSRLGKAGEMLAANPVTRGAIEGGIQGGVTAQPGQRLQGVAFGAGAGASLPAIVKTGRMLAEGVNPTQSARDLMSQGVDLTPGQMNPNGMASQLESAWQSAPFIGPAIAKARKSAENQYKQALIREAGAPGSTITNNADLNGMLDDAYKSFDTAYQSVKGFPLVLQKGQPVIVNQGANIPLSTAFSQVVRDRGVLASSDARRTVGDWLSNQLTKPIKESGDLLGMRSQIRARIRGIKGTTQDDTAAREMLSNAEDAVTKALESQLPADAMQGLKAIDAQYGKYKIVENAVGKGGDKEFTPFQASQAVRQATDKGDYARGGGRLRDLTGAGAETFADTPVTGARMASIALPAALMTAKPMIGIPAALGLAGMSLTKGGRTAAAGNTALQTLMRSIDSKATTALPASTREKIAELLNRGNVAALDKWGGTNTGAN